LLLYSTVLSSWTDSQCFICFLGLCVCVCVHVCVCVCVLGYFNVSIIHWTTRSLTCICDLFACTFTQGTSVYSLGLL